MSSAHPHRPPRVLHLIDSLDLGGAQTVLLNLARALPPAEFHCEAACLHGPGMFAEPLQRSGWNVHTLSPAKWNPIFLPRLATLLARRRFDILHCHLFASNWIGKPLARLLATPIIISHDHCNDRWRSSNPLRLWLDSLLNRSADAIIAVSESTRAFLLEAEALDPSRVHRIYNGVDTSEFQPATPEQRLAARRRWNLPENLPIIGGAGRFTPQKNFGRWLRALADAARDGAQFHAVLFGGGPQEPFLRKECQRLGLTDRVTFAGTALDRAQIFAAMDILLVTSDYEGTPMNVLEAMSAGLCVIASRVDGIAELLEDGRDALLPHPRREWEYPQAIKTALSNPDLRASLAQSARARAERDFSATRMASAIAALYQQLLARARAAHA